MTITTAQIRGARGILNWSQQDLSDRTDISTTSIGSIEKGTTKPRANTLRIIQTAFETEGIEFLDSDGVRQKKHFINTYSGPDQFRDFMDHLYEQASKVGGEIVLFNAHPPHWYKWLGEEWFNMHSKRMYELGNKINFKITAKEGTELLISNEFAEYRFVPEEFFNDRALYAYGENIAFVDFKKDNVTVTVLTQHHFAEAFRTLFNTTWEHVAKKPNT